MAQSGFLGEIRMFGGNFAPRSWAFCEGQLLSIAQNTALFSILGTIYGGDGRTTFALPDLRGRAPISSGTGPGLPTYREGSRSGQATHVLNILELPSHNHLTQNTTTGSPAIGVNNDAADGTTNPIGATIGQGAYNGEDPTGLLGGTGPGTLVVSTSLINQGGSREHENMQPYLAVHYIIALQGTFPSRN